MNSRDTILHRIRSALAGQPAMDPPPVPEVWPRQNLDVPAMAARFCEELQAVHGEVLRVASVEEAGQRLAELSAREGWQSLGGLDRPLCRQLAQVLGTNRVAWPEPTWTPTSMADLPVSLLEADWLLADTGSCVVNCRTAQERLLCYLPPACVIMAHVDRLREHLPAAWPEITQSFSTPEASGETVIITGPSRTADIEKILILGVHGPKRLLVLLAG